MKLIKVVQESQRIVYINPKSVVAVELNLGYGGKKIIIKTNNGEYGVPLTQNGVIDSGFGFSADENSWNARLVLENFIRVLAEEEEEDEEE